MSRFQGVRTNVTRFVIWCLLPGAEGVLLAGKSPEDRPKRLSYCVRDRWGTPRQLSTVLAKPSFLAPNADNFYGDEKRGIVRTVSVIPLRSTMFDESQPEPIVAPNTNNHTKFHWDDLDTEFGKKSRLDRSRQFKNHYDRLSKHNRGLNGKWFDQEKKRQHDNEQIFDAIANYLELPDYHHRVGKSEFERVPLSKWSTPNGVDVFLAAILICAVVCLEDSRFGRAYNPDRKDTSNDDLFLQLLENLSYDESEIRSCYQKALQHVEWTSVDWTEYKTE